MITTKLYRRLKKQEKLSPTQASQVAVYEFLQEQPEKAVVSIKRNVCAPGIVDNKVTVTTDWGQVIGYGKIGNFYKNGSLMGYTLVFTAINNIKYKGIYYSSSGYARVRKVK